MLNLLAAADAKTIIIFVVVGVLLVGMFVFNFFASKKQRKAEADRLKNLKIGDKVLMSCGIQGTITAINEVSPVDTYVTIRTGSDGEPCTLTFDVRAVYRTLDDNGSMDVPANNDETPVAEEKKDENEENK